MFIEMEKYFIENIFTKCKILLKITRRNLMLPNQHHANSIIKPFIIFDVILTVHRL